MCGVKCQRPGWCEDPTHEHALSSEQLPVQQMPDAPTHAEGVSVGGHDGVTGEHAQATSYCTTARAYIVNR